MLIVAIAALIASPTQPPILRPEPAIGAFASVNYAITFIAPVRTTYCPIPADWSGSDHGTVIFLEPPRFCRGVGYPSSSRGFEPDAPRIEVYYGLDLSQDDASPSTPPACNRAGAIMLLGRARALCRSPHRHRVVLWSRATYSTYGPAELILTLVTTRRRLSADLGRFRRFAASVRTCRQVDRRLKGSASTWGTGPRCPKGNWY
ncbi:hypothetical protein ABC974_18370 [Sphingomonas oligophenolica]|uniref:Uncharacterized protein n=1 Tax=Sphingomonas oligophenolica TaxID=301154 RepID=A0ABU9Y721_9SPHN